MADAMRIQHHDFKIAAIKGGVVVAAVPEEDVAIALGAAQSLLVIDAGETMGPVRGAARTPRAPRWCNGWFRGRAMRVKRWQACAARSP